MLVFNFGTPTWRLRNGVNIWNLLWLSKRLIICAEYTNIYINTFPNVFTLVFIDNLIVENILSMGI